MILHHPPSKALPNKLFKEALDRKQSRRDILITHGARTVTFVGGLGRSLGHVVSNHVVSRTKGCRNMAKFHAAGEACVHACRRAAWQACLRVGAPW